MTTERLYEFLILAQTLSYSKAAKKLFVTEATLSRHVAEMEKSFGITLLDRNTHKVHLTEAGKLLMHGAKEILQQYDTSNSRLQKTDVKASGTISIACSPTALSQTFLSFIRFFSEKYQQIDLQVQVTNSETIPVGAVDFAFSPFDYPALSGNISSQVIFTDPAFLAVPNGHKLMYEGQIELSALYEETLIVPYGEELLCSFATNRQLAQRYTGNKLKTIKTTNVETALLLVKLGKGVSIIPQYLAENATMDPKIIGITTPGCKFEIFEYWDKTRNNQTAKLFEEELESYRHK